MKTRMTYRQLLEEKIRLENEFCQLHLNMEKLDGSDYIKAAYRKWMASPCDWATEKPVNRFAQYLAEELTERDWPMTYDDLKEVFEASGFDYTFQDVHAARPDSDFAVREEIRLQEQW